MADEQELDIAEEGSEGTPPPKKKKRKLLIILLVLLVLGAGGGAAWYFLSGNGGKPGAQAEAPDTGPPLFTKLETFTVNLHSENADQYLQVDFDLKVSDEKVIEEVKTHVPEIRNAILLLLSNQNVAELSTLAGKERLRLEIASQINKIIRAKPPKHGVIGVYFTSFVIQ